MISLRIIKSWKNKLRLLQSPQTDGAVRARRKMYKADRGGRWVLFLINVCRLAGAAWSRERSFAPSKVRYNVSRDGGADGLPVHECVSLRHVERYVVMSAASSNSAWSRDAERGRRKGRVERSWVTSRSIWRRGYLDDVRRLIDKNSGDAGRSHSELCCAAADSRQIVIASV